MPMLFRLLRLVGWLTLLGCLGLGVWLLLPRLEQAARQEAALSALKTKEKSPDVWRWNNIKPMPRLLEPSRRDQITADYQAALRELGYASQSGDSSGLRTYFEAAALEDALLAAQTKQRQNTWGHELQLRFYAPDGATVAFTDSAWQGFIWQDNFEVRYQVMDVVMSLSDGNWRVLHWRVLERKIPALTRASSLGSQTLQQLRGVNYVGRLHPFNDFWNNWNSAEVRSSFRLAKAMKLNTVRFFIPYPTPKTVYQYLPALLEIARDEQVQLMPTLLDTYTKYALEDIPAIYQSFVQLLPMLRHSQVLAIDLKNEAERDADQAGWHNIRGLLGFFAVWLAEKTAKPITAGLSDPDQIVSKSLDFVTVHHYGSLLQLETRLLAAQKVGKPVLLQEFGFHTQVNKLPDPHTELEQAEYIAGVLALCQRLGVGWLVWNLHDFRAGTMPNNREVERHLGLVRADGSLKPVAEVLLGRIVTGSWQDKLSKVQALLSLWWLGGLLLIVVLIFRHFRTA